ncbi:activator of HSP90 ATPase [Asanoa ishikariensis]|uniref:Activator of Hsp90 ATPase homolog 1-like protein n=1 Tax=Asanoa ishikariensis TaxID=137265 RepID=A0A1H3UHN0_9ACTN|nr:SRPBCC family protein [Asanoa ishikariensis]GIF63517.1 activator of HSP90 ATPase [Asanoa ishikariensis]SDZ61826.1 Activator of Hsp90 ATPase homolog 1-like protein [Asanoa ishikariensis]
MIDIANHLKAIHREVGVGPAEGGGEEVSVVLRRTYAAPVEDVWDALTDPDRIKRWFYPLTGDLREGGTFQLEGNAGGEIRHCEAPHRLTVTFGGPTSVVHLRLSPGTADDTELELTHTVPIEMAGSGAGALFVGPGWDGALLGLALFFAGEINGDPIAYANSPEVREFSRGSVDAWEAVVAASGTATADETAAGRQMALAQFAPEES